MRNGFKMYMRGTMLMCEFDGQPPVEVKDIPDLPADPSEAFPVLVQACKDKGLFPQDRPFMLQQ